MPVTDDKNDPRLGHGVDDAPVPQNQVYLVLSEEERAKGYVRPVRLTYVHVGAPPPQYPLQDLTEEQQELWGDLYVKYEAYPPEELPATGRFWTQQDIDKVNSGCGERTSMGRAIAETYAREPRFYGSTYCSYCMKHLPVNEFVWAGTDERVGS